MPVLSSFFYTNTDAGSVPLGQSTALQAENDVKMAAGTMSATQLHHKGLEIIETTIEELVVKREITGLTPRAACKNGITASCSLQVQMADKFSKAQTCVLYLRTMAAQLAGKNGLVEGGVYVTLRKHFDQGYSSRNAMAAYLSKALGSHDDPCLKALGRGEHVHVGFIGTLIEQIQLTMQGYTRRRLDGRM
jgi:hypothetical protein